MIRQFAAGGVVIKTERGKPRILLIKDSYGRWTWAKGHIEKGEKPEEAALREITEETGQAKIEIVDLLGKQEYYFVLKGKKIFKTVYVYLVKAASREKIKVQTIEIEKAEWFWPKEAIKKVDYKGTSQFIKKGLKIFKKKYC
jgi:8-oxo-dGTP pyrophosphatase MutT (NUDIX family)